VVFGNGVDGVGLLDGLLLPFHLYYHGVAMEIGDVIMIFGLLVVAFSAGNIIYFLRVQQEHERAIRKYRKEINERTP